LAGQIGSFIGADRNIHDREKENFPRCRFFLTVQSSNLLQLREPVGEDARASEKFAFLNTISMPKCGKKYLMNIQPVILLPPTALEADVPLFVIFLSEKCQPATPAIELAYPRCYRKGCSEPALSRKPVDSGVAMLILLVYVREST